jgi:cell division protein FtsN
MKPRKTPPARKSGGGTLFGLFIGLVIGVIAVAGVVWYINKAPLPFTTNGQQPKLSPPIAGKPVAPTTPEVPPVASAPVALPGKPGDPVPEKPRFDFYKILPGNAEAIPDPKPEEAKPVVSKPGETKAITTAPGEPKPADAKPVDSKAVASKPTESKVDKDNTLKDPIYLQAGSFASASEADNQKARLALLGAEARIQQVMLQDKVWYRVRIGPYHKMDDVNHLRADLARQGIEANVVRKD